MACLQQRVFDEGRAGFVDVVHQDVVLRMEAGQPVAGELMLARRT